MKASTPLSGGVGMSIADQPRLGIMRLIALTATGIRFRLFRSFVLVMVCAVAVAFLVNMLTESLIQEQITVFIQARSEALRQAATWADRLSQPGSTESILHEFIAAPNDQKARRELTRFLGENPVPFAADATLAISYLDYFAGLDYVRRRALALESGSMDIFDRLTDGKEWADFIAKSKALRAKRPPGDFEAFQAFLQRWASLKHAIAKVRECRGRAIATLRGQISGGSILSSLAAEGEEFAGLVRAAGFEFDATESKQIREQARRLLIARHVGDSLVSSASRKRLASVLGVPPSEITQPMIWAFLTDPEHTGIALDILRTQEVDEFPLRDAQELVALANTELEILRCERIEREAGDLQHRRARILWLVAISALVCAVGIANAMFMAVTERFREIATLKCLGAMDKTICIMFILEASFLGVAGGIFGSMAGLAMAMVRLVMRNGLFVFDILPARDLAAATCAAALLGSLLAGMASVIPAIKAARLAPMEAMRVE